MKKFERRSTMNITAIEHYDEILGKGYYLATEYMDKTWYKGETAKDAVRAFLKSKGIKTASVTIFEEV
jgi:hypothetical protein